MVGSSSARATSRRGYVCGYNITSPWKHGGTTANLMSEWVVTGVLHMTPLRGSTSNQLYIAPHSAGWTASPKVLSQALRNEGPLESVGDGSPWSPLYRCLPPARLPPQGPHQVGKMQKEKILYLYLGFSGTTKPWTRRGGSTLLLISSLSNFHSLLTSNLSMF